MNKLLTYLNGLDFNERDAFSHRCRTTVGYIRKACSAGQSIGPEICVAIERATDGAVTRQDLRPSDWQDIWPELVEKAA